MTDFKNGSVKISNNIIDQLIAESALKVEGVASVLGYKNKKVEAKRKDGIVSVIDGSQMDIALNLVLSTKSNIYDVCENVQKNVKEQIKTMLGLTVKNVNIIVKEVID
ncbi:Asp23/Gls24 family envelope stress response protein [Peptoniphilaceae bacterium SGI.131]